MTDREKLECSACEKHGHCAVEAAGGYRALLNSEEREKIARLYNLGIPQLAAAVAKVGNVSEDKDGNFVKNETPMTADEKYLAVYDVANIICNWADWFTPIFTKAKERAEAAYNKESD
jgi:hypothetical protein